MGNVEYREGWIDEGFTSYIASDMALMNANLASWKMMQDYSNQNPTGASYQESRERVNKMMAEDPLEGREHCYLNQPYNVYDEDDSPGDKEYVYAPTFLSKTRAVMGEQEFDTFLKDVYKTFQGKVANTDGLLKLLRSHNNSTEVEDLVAFFFHE